MKSIILLITLCLSSQWVLASGMRCGTKLVSIGDDFDQVTSKCGSPASTYSVGKKIVEAYNPSTGQQEYDQGTSTYIKEYKEILVEVWVYDQGGNKFRKKLFFENGELVSVETGDRS